MTTATWYPATTPLRTMENRLAGSIVTRLGDALLVEVFDHPGTKHNRRLRTTTGPWLAGTPDDVIAELDRLGHEDYEIVARAFHARTPSEISRLVEALT